MHQQSQSFSSASAKSDAATLVLALARKLHRAARADSLAIALPVLRRLLATQTMQDTALPALHRERDKVQRKHILRMLAREAGHTAWEDYRRALDTLEPAQLPHFDLLRSEAGYPNQWFSTEAQAQQHASECGGRVITVGHQAVVLTKH